MAPFSHVAIDGSRVETGTWGSGVENAYPLGTDLARIKEFYDRGMRYMSLAHNGHSQFSDSNTGEAQGWTHHGLSDAGRACEHHFRSRIPEGFDP